jgi:hypothetical protein
VAVRAEESTAFNGTIWFCQVYWGIRFTSTSSTFGQGRSVLSGKLKTVSPDGPAARHHLGQSSVSGSRDRVWRFPSTKSCVNRHSSLGPARSLATQRLPSPGFQPAIARPPLNTGFSPG